MYEGQWRHDREHGQGTLMSSDWRRVIYSGAWEKGKIHRHGSYNYYDAEKGEPCGGYVGQFRQNLRSGHGTYTLPDGSVY